MTSDPNDTSEMDLLAIVESLDPVRAMLRELVAAFRADGFDDPTAHHLAANLFLTRDPDDTGDDDEGD